MTSAWAIAAREYSSMFRIPLGWIVTALFLALSGVLFSRVIQPGEVASMRPFFTIWWSLLVVVAPAISMRLLSDELRSGTIEPLLTAPISEASVVAGKYAASVLFLCTMLAPSLLYVLVIASLSSPDLGPIASGYIGIVLLGMVYLAVGLLASAMTSSQTLAFLGTLFVLLLADVAARVGSGFAPDWAVPALYALSPTLRIDDFAKGVIDTGNVAYFIVVSLWFLAVTTIVLQSRRWR
ncbi:MAG: ABC transporter permease subunit [Phycisphaeraceae bacterium]|nr:ABC transporter permease subunit [Phycisphaeraceae bacterium]